MELRRKSRVSYAELLEGGSDEEGREAAEAEASDNQDTKPDKRKGKGKGKAVADVQSGDDDGSDVYAPENQPSPSEAIPSDGEEASDGPPADEDEGSVGSSDRPVRRRARTDAENNKATKFKFFRRTPSPPPNAPKRVSLASLAPTRNTHATHQAKHSTRYRAISRWMSPRPRRLTEEPEPYGFDGWAKEVPTVSANDPNVLRRLVAAEGKAMGGPRWELLEDRGWFKEGTDREQRPRVWEDVKIKKGGVHSISREEALPYLPSSDTLDEAGGSQPATPFSCYFGRLGEQKQRTMNMLDSFPLKENIPESKAHILNAGGPVHGLAWCPIHPSSVPAGQPMTHRLAVAPFSSFLDQPAIGQRCEPGAEKACIEIWGLGKQGARCEMVLCVEEGPAWQTEWCPLPADDLVESKGTTRKLGLLAGCFRSGDLCIYAVPHPDSLKPKAKGRSKKSQVSHESLYVKLEPLVRLRVDDAGCYCFDWANSSLIAVGCTNGNVAVFDIGPILRDPTNPDPVLRLPTHYLPMHQTCVTSVAWIRSPAQGSDGRLRVQQYPTLLASGGYDGQSLVTDIRDGVVGIIDRMREWITCVKYGSLVGSLVFVEQDYRVKNIALAVVNFGRGLYVVDGTGPIWDIATSDFHHSVAVASADGGVHINSTGRQHVKSTPSLTRTLYQMDYNRKTGEYRMLDNIKPRGARYKDHLYVAAKKRRKAKSRDVSQAGDTPVPPEEDKEEDDDITPSTGTWAPQVGIHRVAWCNGAGMARSMMIASGGASGLVRIDWVTGQWQSKAIPWRKVEVLRSEVDAAPGDPESEDDKDDD